jgi:hypothetical protein
VSTDYEYHTFALGVLAARRRFRRAMLWHDDDGTEAKQSAIQSLEEHAIEPLLDEHRYNFRYTRASETQAEDAKSLLVGPPGFEPGTNGL